MSERTYTEEERDLNGRCSVVMGVQDFFATDHAAARLLEDEIEAAGLIVDYTYTLMLICTPIGGMDGNEVAARWLLIRATPIQKARAFLAVMENR